MAWLNIIAIWILHKPAVNALKDYEIQKKRLGSGYNAVYHPDPKKLPNAVFCEDISRTFKTSTCQKVIYFCL